MNSDWTIVSSKATKAINATKATETEYSLFDLLNKHACIRCMNKTCNINNSHGEKFPNALADCVKYPTRIEKISKAIQDAKLDFSGKTPNYTTCNYVNGNCRNCQSGRVKYILLDRQKVRLCYPDLTNVKDKVTVGVHIDIKVILKGNKCEAFAIPLNDFEEIKCKVVKNTTSLTEENFPSLTPHKEELPENKLCFKGIREQAKEDKIKKEIEEEDKNKRVCLVTSKDGTKTLTIKKEVIPPNEIITPKEIISPPKEINQNSFDKEKILELEKEILLLREEKTNIEKINKNLSENNKNLQKINKQLLISNQHENDIFKDLKILDSVKEQFLNTKLYHYKQIPE